MGDGGEEWKLRESLHEVDERGERGVLYIFLFGDVDMYGGGMKIIMLCFEQVWRRMRVQRNLYSTLMKTVFERPFVVTVFKRLISEGSIACLDFSRIWRIFTCLPRIEL